MRGALSPSCPVILVSFHLCFLQTWGMRARVEQHLGLGAGKVSEQKTGLRGGGGTLALAGVCSARPDASLSAPAQGAQRTVGSRGVMG